MHAIMRDNTAFNLTPETHASPEQGIRIQPPAPEPFTGINATVPSPSIQQQAAPVKQTPIGQLAQSNQPASAPVMSCYMHTQHTHFPAAGNIRNSPSLHSPPPGNVHLPYP